MKLEDLIEFAVGNGGDVSFSTHDDFSRDAKILRLSARLTSNPSLDRNQEHVVDVAISNRDILQRKSDGVIKRNVQYMVGQVYPEVRRLQDEQDFRSFCDGVTGFGETRNP